MAVEKKSGKTDLIVGLILVFCVCLLSFSVGTFVGKKFSDQQHKMSQYEPGKKDSQEMASHEESHEPIASDDKTLSAEDVAKLAAEFVAEEEQPTDAANHKAEHKADDHQHGKVAENTPTRQVASETTGHSEMKVELHKEPKGGTQTAKAEDHEEIHSEQNVAAVKSEVTATQPVHDSSANKPVMSRSQSANVKTGQLPAGLKEEVSGKFTVQIASYASEKEAQAKVSEFKEKFPAFFIPAVIKDKKTAVERTMFRVNLGIFATQREAEAYRKDLIAREKVASSAFVQKLQ